eukprot:4423519-Prorocentrum_lima.AAC.1
MTSSLVGSEMCIRDSFRGVSPSFLRSWGRAYGLRTAAGALVHSCFIGVALPWGNVCAGHVEWKYG